jgi:Fe-S-cluster-containing hydrogenase component 2
MAKSKAILIDITKCIGCKSCEAACKQLHGFPQDSEARLSPTAFTIVEEHGDRFVRRMCMNCQDPACASACLVGALKKTDLGPVTYDSSKCIGCRYCLVACPFNVPRYQWAKLAPFVTKCDMCYARQRLDHSVPGEFRLLLRSEVDGIRSHTCNRHCGRRGISLCRDLSGNSTEKRSSKKLDDDASGNSLKSRSFFG